MIDNPSEMLRLVGASAQDLSWFESFGWRDDGVPPASAQDVEAFRRREALLNASLEGLTFAERGTSKAGHLAAAIGARIADFEDARAGDDEAD